MCTQGRKSSAFFPLRLHERLNISKNERKMNEAKFKNDLESLYVFLRVRSYEREDFDVKIMREREKFKVINDYRLII